MISYKLKAGPLDVLFEDGGLRYIRLGSREIVRRIYVAVRDRHWETIASTMPGPEITKTDSAFNVTFEMIHQNDEIDFFWRGIITGDQQGTIVFNMEGEARSTFLRNRIGICVLHPIEECEGRPCAIEQVDGNTLEGNFPLSISPHQPFFNIKAMTHEVLPGLRATVHFDGDVFEMEDQRNWTDASYKTYSTPLALPFPVEVKQGTKISQTITITLEGEIPEPEPDIQEVTLSIEKTSKHLMPRLGFGISGHKQPLTRKETDRLKLLNLSHLRADLHFSDNDFEADLKRASDEARSLDLKLEAALFLSDSAEEELKKLRDALDRIKPSIKTWLVFKTGEKVTSDRWIRLAREYLQSYDTTAGLGSGTNIYFTEINRNHPPLQALDLVCYSINPQCHAFDDLTLIENLQAQGETVRSAREIIGDLPLAITPVTLRPRFNPNKLGLPPETISSGLPFEVDIRQTSLLAAAWTLGSLKYLAESGVQSVTFYETDGWLGVMERDEGSPLPEYFHSIPGSVFPLYHVLADIAEFHDGKIAPVYSEFPLKAIGLAVRYEGKNLVLVANLSAENQVVKICGLDAKVRVRKLNEDTVEMAVATPEIFRAQSGEIFDCVGDCLILTMKAKEVVRISEWMKP